jgi:hypothetical protein
LPDEDVLAEKIDDRANMVGDDLKEVPDGRLGRVIQAAR